MTDAEQPELFPRPVDAMYVVMTWTQDDGWTLDLRAKPEGDSFTATTLREHYERLALAELLDILPDGIERLRGF